MYPSYTFNEAQVRTVRNHPSSELSVPIYRDLTPSASANELPQRRESFQFGRNSVSPIPRYSNRQTLPSQNEMSPAEAYQRALIPSSTQSRNACVISSQRLKEFWAMLQQSRNRS